MPGWTLHRLSLLPTLILIGSVARADVAEVVQDHILPGYTALADATAALSASAQTDCTAEALAPAFHATYDAWMAVSHLRMGPVEEDGMSLAFAYWPDPKGSGARAQRSLLANPDKMLDAAAFSRVSVAARGLAGLDRLLFADPPLGADNPEAACTLIRLTAEDMNRMARSILAGWTGGYDDVVLTAGEPGNTTYLSQTEARQAMLTLLHAGLEFLIDERLGRPMGSFDKPAPEKAEARDSGRSLRNVLLELQALRRMTRALDPEAVVTLAALDKAVAQAEALDDPVFDGVATPSGRLKVEILQQSVITARDAVLSEIAPHLGVGLGFNAADGD